LPRSHLFLHDQPVFADISGTDNGEAPNEFNSHVAAVSWADTQTPETTLGNHSPKKAGFLSGNQTEVFCFGSLATFNK